jgi:riboflavin synthase
MFTGIIESLGEIVEVRTIQSNKEIRVRSALSNGFRVDQSVSHNGVCLTVVGIEEDIHTVMAVQETLLKSNLGSVVKGDLVNIERCMVSNGRFDGHIVQGHVDQTARVHSVVDADGSWLFTFEYDPSIGNITVEKGSIAVNGISVTCFDSLRDRFTVAVIPYTFEHTNMSRLKRGDIVNLEFDIIGKYVKRLLEVRG